MIQREKFLSRIKPFKSGFFFVFVFLIFTSYADAQKYSINWGHLSNSFDQSKNPNVYNYFRTLTSPEVQFLVKSPLTIISKGKVVNGLKEMNLYYHSSFKPESGLIPIKFEGNKPDSSDVARLLTVIRDNDQLIVGLKTFDNDIINIKLKVDNNQKSYTQPLFIPHFSARKKYGYQLVQLINGHQVLKIDTTINVNKEIFKPYLTLKNMSVNHISGFETFENYIKTVDTTITLGKTVYNLHPITLPRTDYLASSVEPTELLLKEMKLRWGRIVAEPDSPIYSLKWAKTIANQPVQILIDNTVYTIEAMRFTFYDGKELNASYFIENDSEIPRSEFSEMNFPFSILIDRIFVKDAKGRLVHIPQPFLFNFD